MQPAPLPAAVGMVGRRSRGTVTARAQVGRRMGGGRRVDEAVSIGRGVR